MKNIKKAVKESILQNFMEAAKFARRGAEKQRPKSWSKGTKSGSDKRKMREEGKREAGQMNEYYNRDPGYQYNPQPDDPRPGQPGGPPDPEAEREEMGKRISNAVHDWVEETGLHIHHGHSTKQMREVLNARIENSYDNIADAASHLIDVYPAPEGVDPEQYKKHMEQGIHGYATGGSLENRNKMLAGNPYYDAINESYNTTSYFYNKLKENTDIPRHARETPEETPDYYGELERQREAGTSNEEPPPSVADRLTQAHENALAAALEKHGKGSKKPDDFNVIRSYLENIERHHLRIMGDIS